MKKLMKIATMALVAAVVAGSVEGRSEAATFADAAQNLSRLNFAMGRALLRAPLRNQKIVKYGLAKMGTKVGNGQCTELIKGALIVSRSRGGNFSDEQNYNWGRPLAAGEAISVGDIIQFEGCTFTHKSVNGNSTSTSTSTMPHHSAIVRFARGTMLVLLNQNLDGSPVKQTVIDLNDKASGRYTVFAPLPR
jgi:hypothetical protein